MAPCSKRTRLETVLPACLAEQWRHAVVAPALQLGSGGEECGDDLCPRDVQWTHAFVVRGIHIRAAFDEQCKRATVRIHRPFIAALDDVVEQREAERITRMSEARVAYERGFKDDEVADPRRLPGATPRCVLSPPRRVSRLLKRKHEVLIEHRCSELCFRAKRRMLHDEHAAKELQTPLILEPHKRCDPPSKTLRRCIHKGFCDGVTER